LPVRLAVTFLLLLVASYTLSQPDGYAPLDGIGNNEENPLWSSVLAPFFRPTSTTTYLDGVATINDTLPNPREISNRLCAEQTIPSPLLNDLHIAFGQFVSHDVQGVSSFKTLGEHEVPGEAVQIPIPIGDPFFDPHFTGTKSFTFTRVPYIRGTGEGNTPRATQNIVTPLLDLSTVYSEDEATLKKLLNETHPQYFATSVTQTGELMLPFNTKGLNMSNAFPSQDQTSLYAAGDRHANQNPLVLCMPAVFILEHNHLVDELAEKHKQWSSAKLFWEARKRNIAKYQAVVLNEYLPTILGEALPAYTGYNPDVKTDISFVYAYPLFFEDC